MTKLKMFSFLLLLLFLSSTSIFAQTLANDSLSLVAFNNALNGQDWKVKWDFNKPLKDWYGVRIVEGRVKYLTLYGNNLKGKIPNELGHLTGLQSLNLGNNHFDGNLPASIEYLDNLDRLFIQNGTLSGPLPAEIGLLDNLAYLGLKNNQISGELPKTLGLLPKLVSLYLEDNQFTGAVPKSMATMDSLRIISLNNNQLSAPIDRDFVKARISLKVANNKFTFNDLLPISSMATQLNRCGHKTFHYDDQATLQLPASLQLYPKQSSVINIPEVASKNGNVYKWFKDGEFLETRYSNDFAIKKMDGFKEGSYSCEISNPNVPDLILYTTDIQVSQKKWNGETYNDITTAGGLNIFPNPTNGAFSYTFNNDVFGNYTVTVTDVLGRAYFTEEITKNDSSFKGDITISGLSSGIYLLSVQNESNKFSGKLTVIEND